MASNGMSRRSALALAQEIVNDSPQTTTSFRATSGARLVIQWHVGFEVSDIYSAREYHMLQREYANAYIRVRMDQDAEAKIKRFEDDDLPL